MFVRMVTASLKGNKHVIVAIDVFTKFVDAKAVPDVTAESFIQFLNEYCWRFGTPKTISTNNAKTFTASAAKAVISAFGAKHLKSAPLHSKGNTVVERVIQTISEKIAMIASDRRLLS